MKDMKAFGVITLYAVTAFGFFYDACGLTDDYKLNFLAATTHSLGDWELDDIKNLQWVIFSMAIIFNLIVMLNLLIAVIGDTFDKVQADAAITDALAQLDLILEIEMLLPNNRKKSSKQYIQRCVVNRGHFSEEDWEGKVQVLCKQVAKTSDDQKKILKQHELKLEMLTQKLEESQNQRFTRIEEQYDQKLSKLEEMLVLHDQRFSKIEELQNQSETRDSEILEMLKELKGSKQEFK